jgi:TPR repeat protein
MAQNDLGFMYEKGRGVPQNDVKAVEWYSKAANQNDARGKTNLGFMYENGRGGLPRTQHRQPAGTAKRHTRAIPMRKTVWACYGKTEKVVCRSMKSRQLTGIARQPNRATR